MPLRLDPKSNIKMPKRRPFTIGPAVNHGIIPAFVHVVIPVFLPFPSSKSPSVLGNTRYGRLLNLSLSFDRTPSRSAPHPLSLRWEKLSHCDVTCDAKSGALPDLELMLLDFMRLSIPCSMLYITVYAESYHKRFYVINGRIQPSWPPQR